MNTTTTNIIYSFQVFPMNGEALKNEIIASTADRKERCEALQRLKDTLMLPSGKARKGGRAEVAAAEAQVNEANTRCNKADAAYRAAIQPLLIDLCNKHFRANLSSFDDTKSFDPVLAAKVKDAAIKSFDSFEEGRRGKSFSITDSNGFEFNITTHHDGFCGFRIGAGDEPYSLGGGEIELGANAEGYTFYDEASKTYIIDAPKGRFDFTDATPRKGYKVRVSSLRERNLKHIATMGKVMSVLAELGEHLNATDYSANFTCLSYHLADIA